MTAGLWDLVAATAEGGSMARAVKAGHCPACTRPWLYALDDDVCALPAKVGPEPLSGLGEVQATIAGLRTFELRRTKGGFVLDWRDAWLIRGRPAGTGVVDVLGEHRCGVALATGPPVIRPRQPSAVATVPPF